MMMNEILRGDFKANKMRRIIILILITFTIILSVQAWSVASGGNFNVPTKNYSQIDAPLEGQQEGLVSINTEKSLYHLNEMAKIILVVLDKDSYPVSNADVSLVIKDPTGISTTYSTSENTIIETERGIYEARYLTKEEGNYALLATATANGVESSISSYFSVSEYYEFDILRDMPVMIDPTKGPFDSSIKVISYTDVNTFTLKEYLPIEFEVTDFGRATITIEEDAKVLTWTNLENNSAVSYSAQVPLIMPYLYELGPAKISYNLKTFTEARPWYVAVDPSQVSTQVFWDSFEDLVEWSNWTESGEGDWVIETPSTTIAVDGSYVAHSDNCDTGCQLTSVAINLSGYSNASLTFKWGTDGLGAGEYLAVDIYNGTWYEDVWSVTETTGAGSETIDLSPYGMVSNLQIRFDTLEDGPNDDAEFDAVNITAWVFSPEVEIPKTYDNATLAEKTTFERNDGMTVRVNVTDGDGQADLDTVLIEISNTTGDCKVCNESITDNNITEITNGYTYEYNYTIPSDADVGTWTINVYANDTSGYWDSNTTSFEVIEYGWLNVSLLTPSDNTDWIQNETYWVNATVTCEGGAGAVCGTVQGGARYNETSEADTLINTTEGAIPFYVTGGGGGLSTYDFSGIVNPSSTHKAEYGSDSSRPCGNGLACNSPTEFADAYVSAGAGGNYSNITSAGDGSEASWDEEVWYAYHRFRFVIDEDENDITELNISWRGYATEDGSAIGAYLYVWNSTDWQLVGSHSTGSPDWINASYTDSTNITNFVNETNGYLYLLAETENDGQFSFTERIATDYVKVDVYGIGAQNPKSCPSALNNGDSCQLNWTVNVTGNVSSWYEIDVNFTSSYSQITENSTSDSTIHIIAPTWDSYSDLCSTQDDTFYQGDTIYVCGNGFTPSKDYDVAIYNDTGTRVYYGSPVAADASGQLNASYLTDGTEGTGNWHSQVFVYGTAPSTYTSDDPNEIAEDLSACSGTCAFTVSVAAPEFAYVIIPIILSSMIYFWMRKRFKEIT